ncbi:MAG: M15 family metallopeptidase [Bacteroidia bacterium]|nr:M15 family metallopeptidase [Bacteroidia bacterium]
MKRREFLTLTTSGTMVLSFFPLELFAKNDPISYDELIGKGTPNLQGNGYKLRTEVNDAFLSMVKEAKTSGIDIRCVSGYRSFNRQKAIWERKYRKYRADGLKPEKAIRKIIEYSTIPGTSRHHWGTDLDLVDGNFIDTPNLLSESNFEKGKPFHKLKIWLDENAGNYGFYEVYTNDPERKGFKYEPWHFSYKALAVDYLKQYKKLDVLSILQSEEVKGSNHFTAAFISEYIEQNILDINPELLP